MGFTLSERLCMYRKELVRNMRLLRGEFALGCEDIDLCCIKVRGNLMFLAHGLGLRSVFLSDLVFVAHGLGLRSVCRSGLIFLADGFGVSFVFLLEISQYILLLKCFFFVVWKA